MSHNTSKAPNIGAQIGGYIIYAIYADKLAIGRALLPENPKQYALILNRKYIYSVDKSEWYIGTTYTDRNVAEKNFVNECFSWLEIAFEELHEPESQDDKILLDDLISIHSFSPDDDRNKIEYSDEEN